jgi:hypothetical protein
MSYPPYPTGDPSLFIQPSPAASYKQTRHFSFAFASGGCALLGNFADPAFPHNPQQPVDANAVVMRGIFGGFSMSSGLHETAIDEIVARCNGDIRGALKALLLVNEQLEAELAELHAAVAHGGLAGRKRTVLH